MLVASSASWYAARAGGVTAYLLVSVCVLAGILLAGKTRVPGLPRFAVEDVHRFLGLLAGLFIAVHVGGVVLDSVVPFSLSQLVVPFTAGYRPLATGLGIVAVELLLALAITNRLRSRLPYRLWRRAHYATLVVWLLATVHGILSGSDRDQMWLQWLYAAVVATVAGAAALRFGRAPAGSPYGRSLAAAGASFAAILGLALVPQPSPGSAAAAAAPAADVPAIDAELRGTIERDGAQVLTISGSAGTAAFRIDLLENDGRATDTALQMRFANGVLCEGTLTALDTTGFTGTCAAASGAARTVSASWTVADSTVSGTLSTSSETTAA